MKIKTLIFFTLFSASLLAQRDSIFSSLSFGKNMTTFYLGSGAFKRHLDLNLLNPDANEYFKTPAFTFGVDHCFYPYASNAYLGIGPFISGWIAKKNIQEGNKNIESVFSNLLLAVKLTHHSSFFVRKKLDLLSGYIVGVSLKQHHSYFVDGISEYQIKPGGTYDLALGISASLRYYFYKNVGTYLEVGLGYNLNLLNIGICYKYRKT